jgi:hypothetical protein
MCRLPELVYRGLTKKKHISDDNRTVTFEAYLRRDRDTDGLSVGATQYAVTSRLMFPLKGIASLPVEGIRRMYNDASKKYLDVVFDHSDHGNINRGVPYLSQDPNTAEALGGDLARISTLL